MLRVENPDRNGYSLLNSDHRLKPTSKGIVRIHFWIQVHQPWTVLALSGWLISDQQRALKRKIFNGLSGSFVLETIFISML